MTVAIVGAGPGDPKLITVRGLELVQRCEILIYDRLAPVELVLHAEGAVRIARDRLSQDEVNALLIKYGRFGRRVVRLKNGDPFLYGRGSEEAEALDAAGLPYEIVPGLSTLTAIPTLAGIPLTARGVASQLTVITGSAADGEDLDYERLANTPGTLVIFMGLRRLPRVADELILAGRSLDEPAAVVSRLSLPDAQVRTGTLSTIARATATMPTPAVVIIGDVVSLLGRSASLEAQSHPASKGRELPHALSPDYTSTDSVPQTPEPGLQPRSVQEAMRIAHPRRTRAIAIAVDRLLARMRGPAADRDGTVQPLQRPMRPGEAVGPEEAA